MSSTCISQLRNCSAKYIYLIWSHPIIGLSTVVHNHSTNSINLSSIVCCNREYIRSCCIYQNFVISHPRITHWDVICVYASGKRQKAHNHMYRKCGIDCEQWESKKGASINEYVHFLYKMRWVNLLLPCFYILLWWINFILSFFATITTFAPSIPPTSSLTLCSSSRFRNGVTVNVLGCFAAWTPIKSYGWKPERINKTN